MASGVGAIRKDGEDSAGALITEVYAFNPPFYAIYRTETRVLIEYADNDEDEQKQRMALAPLGPLRSQINGLIDGWRLASSEHRRAKAASFDRRTSDALVMALEHDLPNAIIELNAVRNAIIDGRTSKARFMYLAIAFLFAMLVTAVIAIVSQPVVNVRGHWPQVDEILIAVVGGAAGAFFSIAIGLSKRTVLTDLQQRDNEFDAVLRMVIGVVSAAVLICLLRSGFGVSLAFAPEMPMPKGATSLPNANLATVPWMRLITIGFLAGFSERLVPDLLAKAGAAMEPVPLPPKPPLVTPPPTVSAAPSPAPVSLPSPGDCLCDVPLSPADAVTDEALPAATGGVAAGDVS